MKKIVFYVFGFIGGGVTRVTSVTVAAAVAQLKGVPHAHARGTQHFGRR